MRVNALAAFLAVVLCTAVGPAVAAAPVGPTGGPLRHVVLQLKWKHDFQFAGYYAAIEHGYYRDAGIDVELREAGPGDDPIRDVVGGRAQFGVSTSELVVARAKGAPVVVLATIYQHSPFVLLTVRNRGVDDLQSLAGKTIMLDPDSAEILAYLKAEGVDPSRVKVVPQSQDVRDLIRGRVAAMSAYATDEPYALDREKVPYNTFTPRSGGIDFYGDNLFTTEETIRRDPELVRAFRAASLRGWEYAMAHREELVAVTHRYAPALSADFLRFEGRVSAGLIHPELIELGHVNPGRWEHIAETYQQVGMIGPAFSLSGFLYDPDPKPDLRWLYASLIALAILTVAAFGWALPLYVLNRKLRVANAEAHDANEAKSRYVAVMSHEIRSPLTNVLGFAELLLEEDLPEEPRDFVRRIHQAARTMLKLINNVLDYAKFEAGAMTLESDPVDVGEVVRECCVEFHAAAEHKGIALVARVDADVPRRVELDELRFRQIVTNLLSNAVKFTTKGRVAVRLGMRPGGDGTARLLLEVEDTGVGIPQSALATLFEPYSQADPSVARRFGGTGLGLAVVRSIARAMGGDIEVHSAPGEGTTFAVTLLLGRGQRAPTANV